jgi:hypothetical protein
VTILLLVSSHKKVSIYSMNTELIILEYAYYMHLRVTSQFANNAFLECILIREYR